MIEPHPEFDDLTAAEIRAAIAETEEKLKLAKECGNKEIVTWQQQEIRLAESALAHRLGTVHQPATENDWPPPQPLELSITSQPYPMGALPAAIGDAVAEVQQFIKAPVGLVASSALGVLSLAAQAQVDVVRADKLQGPISLFMLIIASSGERKSTADGLFTKALSDHDKRQLRAASPSIDNFKADMEAWEAKRAGLRDRIRQLSKDGKSTTAHEQLLRESAIGKPNAPRVPRLLWSDASVEELRFALAKKWPSAGIISAEAGIVFGSHAMGADSLMRNLATCNELWDGRTIIVDRRTSESFMVRGARLTLSLQIQEETLTHFLDRAAGLARGSGFLARFLVAWPDSTQGSRKFTEPPANWPALDGFNCRISEILNEPAPMDADGALCPIILSMNAAAKDRWIAYHDAVERDLSAGQSLFDIRDVASKSADNVARIAALFHVFRAGREGPIDRQDVDGACEVGSWHLSESRRFFGDIALPQGLVKAAHLDSYMIEYCRRGNATAVPTRTIQQYGPRGTREKAALDAAIRELEELNRCRVAQDGRRHLIELNPALLTVATVANVAVANPGPENGILAPSGHLRDGDGWETE